MHKIFFFSLLVCGNSGHVFGAATSSTTSAVTSSTQSAVSSSFTSASSPSAAATCIAVAGMGGVATSSTASSSSSSSSMEDLASKLLHIIANCSVTFDVDVLQKGLREVQILLNAGAQTASKFNSVLHHMAGYRSSGAADIIRVLLGEPVFDGTKQWHCIRRDELRLLVNARDHENYTPLMRTVASMELAAGGALAIGADIVQELRGRLRKNAEALLDNGANVMLIYPNSSETIIARLQRINTDWYNFFNTHPRVVAQMEAL